MAQKQLLAAITVLASVAVAAPSAWAQVTPPPPVPVTSPAITINSSPGDQTDPHVDKDFASYTDSPTNQIRYYQFSTGIDAPIPLGGGVLFDVLSDVNGGRVAFSSVELDRNAIAVFDIATASVTEIDPHPGSNRLGAALGGSTLAFIDMSTGNGDVYAFDLANPSLAPQLVSASPDAEQNPNVSPDGNIIVWEDCPVSIVVCNVFKGVRSGGVWSVSAVADTSAPEGNPDTDGGWIAYDSRDADGTGHIHFVPAGGGADAVTGVARISAESECQSRDDRFREPRVGSQSRGSVRLRHREQRSLSGDLDADG